MVAHDESKYINKFKPSQRLKTSALVCVGLGVVAFAVGFWKNPGAMWPAYLTAFFYVSLLGLGGLFWTAINNISKAGWSVSLRRLAEGMTAFIPIMVVASFVLLAGVKYLYPWAQVEEVNANPVIATKSGYLNVPFLVIRLLVFGLGVLAFQRCIVGNSLKQDVSGDEIYTHKNVSLGVAFILFFALSFTMFSIDLIMSLLPTWYSTIFGVYCFAGMFQSSLAAMILILLYMKQTKNICGYYTEDHIHDVAKYLKGFTVFWAYIAFSQFMLIWYANIPEETEYYLMRIQNGWMGISMLLLIGKFIIPFLALLPRGNKRNPVALVCISVWILVMQYIDVYWMVGPNFNENQMSWGFYDLALLLGFLGLLQLAMIRFFGRNNLVAVKDPRMHEALGHHVTY